MHLYLYLEKEYKTQIRKCIRFNKNHFYPTHQKCAFFQLEKVLIK